MLFLLFHYSNGEDGCYTEKKKITKRLGYTFFFFVPLSFLFCSVTSNYPKEKKGFLSVFFPTICLVPFDHQVVIPPMFSPPPLFSARFIIRPVDLHDTFYNENFFWITTSDVT